jgi:hypothetical protein
LRRAFLALRDYTDLEKIKKKITGSRSGVPLRPMRWASTPSRAQKARWAKRGCAACSSPTQATAAKVYKLSPYTDDPNTLTKHSSDRVYTQQHGSSSLVKLKRRGKSLKKNGLLGTITLAVDPTASY